MISETAVVRSLGLAAVLLAAACGGPERPDEAGEAQAAVDGPLVVYAVSYPLAYFAERIGGDPVRVGFPAPTGIDPAFWSPDPETIAAYQSADLILLNGAGYADWVRKVSLPGSRLVNTSASFEELHIVEEEAVVHTHGPEGEHEHRNVAFTTWLDPMLALEQARSIKEAMSAARPPAAAAFEAGFAALEADLDELDARLEGLTASAPGKPLLASHPVYQYLSRRYSLNLRSVHFEPDQIPTESMWRELAGLLDGHGAGWILWEGEPAAETATRLSDRFGVQSAVFDPCGNRPAEGDFMSVMNSNVAAMEKVFADGG